MSDKTSEVTASGWKLVHHKQRHVLSGEQMMTEVFCPDGELMARIGWIDWNEELKEDQ